MLGPLARAEAAALAVPAAGNADDLEPTLLPNQPHPPAPCAPSAALSAWTELLGVPPAGGRFGGVRVVGREAEELCFAVSVGPPLKVIVRAFPGESGCYAHSRRFGLAYAVRPGRPLTRREVGFLDWLVAMTRRRDP